MKKSIDLSIIIISYNTKKLLESCLRSVFKSLNTPKISYEIIVVDNHSTDGSQEMVRSLFKTVRLIQNKTNAGFGKANNQGIKSAQGSTVLLLNSDIEVKDNAIENLYQFFIKNHDDVYVGGKLFNTDNSAQASCGPKYSLLNIFIALFLKGDYTGLTRYSPNEIKEVDWIMGACIMAKKDTFLKTGLFDEGIFMYMEEIDLFHRAKKIEQRIFFYPDAQFIHHGAASSMGRSEPILNVFRGLKYFYKKHYSLFSNVILSLILAAKSIIASMMFAILGRQKDQDLYKQALKIALS